MQVWSTALRADVYVEAETEEEAWRKIKNGEGLMDITEYRERAFRNTYTMEEIRKEIAESTAEVEAE